MGAMEQIKSRIPDFAGYETADGRSAADEQIRAFAGERLAAVDAERLDTLDIDDRARYDRLLLRSEFVNQMAFHDFQENPSANRIGATLDADARLIEQADALQSGGLETCLVELERAFDARDSALSAQ
jgi:hypothetical protein